MAATGYSGFLRSALLLSLLSAGAATAAPAVEGAWVRLSPVSSRPAGGYFTVKGGPKADALVGASSPKAERVEMHSMTMTDGVMRMRAEKSLAVPAYGKLLFAPGGNHLMLFGVAAGVQPGQTVPLTLVFQSGAKVTTTAEVRAANAPAKAAEPMHQH